MGQREKIGLGTSVREIKADVHLRVVQRVVCFHAEHAAAAGDAGVVERRLRVEEHGLVLDEEVAEGCDGTLQHSEPQRNER